VSRAAAPEASSPGDDALGKDAGAGSGAPPRDAAAARPRKQSVVEAEGSGAPWRLALDRDLPLTVGVQLRGQIEYGIATGEIPRGTKLPSVRELARQLHLAPATVSQVYGELRQQGLLESQQGRGTFVPERLPPQPATEAMVALGHAVDAFFASAEAHGFSRSAAAEAATVRAHRPARHGRAVRILFVGIFPDATLAYVEAIRRHLPPGDMLEWTTYEAGTIPTPGAGTVAPDVYVTLANREAELRALVGDGVPVLSLTFHPSRETRTRLAAVPPDACVVVVASIPEFLPTLRRNVTRFCPHVRKIEAVPLAPEALALALRRCSVMVYATGTRDALTHVPPNVDAFEFRYEPEVSSINRLLLPTLESVRQERTAKE